MSRAAQAPASLMSAPLALLVVALAFAAPSASLAVERSRSVDPSLVAGTWEGMLRYSGAEFRLVFRIRRDNGEGLSGTLDSPDQGALGIPLSRVERTEEGARFTTAAIGGEFEGRWAGDGRLDGTWRQAGLELPLTLDRRGDEAPAVPRLEAPDGGVGQVADEDLTFRTEEVSYTGAAGVSLAGTLTLPEGNGPFPAVLLISGSGPQDRDSTIAGHRPFAVLAEHLARLGIVSLRVDDRGVGGSSGDLASTTLEDLAADARAGLRWLRSRPETDLQATGLVGHSEGALVGAMAAAAGEPAVDFLVLLAPPAVPGRAILLRQGELIAGAAGASEEARRRDRTVREEIIEAVLGAADTEAAEAAVWDVLNRHLAVSEGEPQATVSAALEAQVSSLSAPWLREFLRYDPAPALAQVECPVLALWGGRDLQVPPTQSRPALEAAVSDDRRLTTRVLPGLNHLLQTAETGLPVEYSQIEETLAPQALELIGGWIRGVSAVRPGDH